MCQAQVFGPTGLNSISQIFISIGHRDGYHYMCLSVNSGHGDVSVLVHGGLCGRNRKDPMLDPDVMRLCRQGFNDAVIRVLHYAYDEAQRGR